MCGINGFTFHDPERLRAMHAATHHRGPDDEGFFQVPEMSMAHNRLSIIDLSPTGRQPMMSRDDRYTIVFNGEIYNYRELRAELEAMGETFRGASDTEVLLAGWTVWGERLLQKLNGIFAFALWDRDEERLTLVRDQIGVKPLYYFWDGKALVFSSEIKGILASPDIPREVDLESLSLYCRLLYVPSPRTMFKGILKLPAGHLATYAKGSFEVRRWWSVREGTPIASYADAVLQVRETTMRAVKRQLVSDRPLGLFLSGGIDSTSILGMMRAADAGTIKTFSVGYDTTIDSEKYNADLALAKKSAAFFGTEHHELQVRAQDVLDALQHVAYQMDEPISNHVQTSTYLLAQYAKPTITVALGGDGGDELFGGYPRYWYASVLDRIGWAFAPLRSAGVRRVMPDALLKHALVQKGIVPPGMERFLSFVAQKEDAVRAYLKPAADHPGLVHEVFAPYFAETWNDRTNQLMATDIQAWLPDESLARTDKMTMAHGLEERVPLLDLELVELAMRIPSSFKLGSREQGKRVFIDSMKPFLPSHVLHEEKRAWMSPAAKWIRGPLLPFVREVLSPAFNPETTAWFDFDALSKILEDHLAHRSYGLHVIWPVLTFQLWYRAYIKK